MIIGLDKTVIPNSSERGGFQVVPAIDGTVRMVILHEGTQMTLVMTPEEASAIGTTTIKASAVAALQRDQAKAMNGHADPSGIVLPRG